MVKLSIKNITNCIDNELVTSNLESNPFIISISEKTKIDSSFNKFLTLGLKYNILIFEKNNDESWAIKSKQNILNQIEKLIRTAYNDHIINITQISIESNDEKIFTNIKQTLDKLHNGLKKKLIDLYEIKSLLEIIDLNLNLQSEKKIKKKKIINNDIYIEEFSN
jgi:hypothetical protein